MPTNDWSIGSLYLPGGPGGYWTQPGGPFTTVFPKQVTGNSNLLSTEPYNEFTGTYMFGCGHSQNRVEVYRDYDYGTSNSVALLCCPLCSYLQRTIEPFEAAVMGNAGALLNSILFP